MPQLIPFKPALWARDTHSQTILADLLPSPPMTQPGHKWIVELDDGDQLLCHLSEGTSDFVVLLCHGLTGDSNAGYNHRIGQIFKSQGHTVCRMNHRNCGEGFGLARKPYHAGRSEDLARIIFELRKLYPKKKVMLIGFSMSGNAALLLCSGVVPSLGISDRVAFLEQAENHHWALPDFAIAVNPPVELSRTTDRLLKNFNRFYQWNFVRIFQKILKDLHQNQLIERSYDIHPLMTIRQFDDLFTAHRSGFASAENFYQLCAAKTHLRKVFIPTYILATKDDPIIDYQELVQAEKSPHVRIHIENNGGHMGFLHQGKTPLGDNRWMDHAVYEMFKALI